MAYSHIFIYFDQKYGYQHHIDLWNESNAKINYKKPLESLVEPDMFVSKRQHKLSGVYDSFYRSDIHLWRRNQNYKIFSMLYQPQSVCGICYFSLFLMSLVGVLWLIIETVYTVPARFDIEGIVGIVIGSPSNVRQLNPIQTANNLILSTDKYNTAIFLSTCYWLTIIIFPIITQIVLILIWFCPLKHVHFRILLKSIWFVQAWNALDVFFVGSVSGAIEMNTVSQWIVDSNYAEMCGEDGILTEELGMGCFNVVGTITRGSWMAGAAAIIQWYSIWFSLKTAKDIGIHGMEY